MELYDSKNMPFSNNPQLRIAQERYARGERFPTLLGRDQGKIKKELVSINDCYRMSCRYELFSTSI